MVTHDPRAAGYASRELHLDKGQSHHAMQRGALHEVLSVSSGRACGARRPHDLHDAVDRRRVPALRPAAGNQSGLQHASSSNLNVDRLYVSAKTNMIDGLPIAHAKRIKAVPGVAPCRTGPGSAATSAKRANRFPPSRPTPSRCSHLQGDQDQARVPRGDEKTRTRRACERDNSRSSTAGRSATASRSGPPSGRTSTAATPGISTSSARSTLRLRGRLPVFLYQP